MSKWSIAIADDNERMTEILSEIMKQDEDLQVVGIAHNGEEACQLIRDKGPDIMLLDIIMPKLDGLSVMERISPGYEDQKEAGVCCCIRHWTGTDHRRCIFVRRKLLHYETF